MTSLHSEIRTALLTELDRRGERSDAMKAAAGALRGSVHGRHVGDEGPDHQQRQDAR